MIQQARHPLAVPFAATLLATFLSLSAVAMPAAAHAADAGTSWASSVQQHLAAQGVADAEPAAAQPAIAGSAASTHPVTAWARSVEQRLSLRAHHVAEVGRSALAWSEHGMASWYGKDHVGRRTSSGTRFDPMQLTCAHPTLPLGTRLLVTSETTGRSVVVTVNDRGPFGNRIVDLSRAAAARIGMLGSGTASVTLQQASPEVIEVAAAAESDTTEQAMDAVETGDQASRSPRGQRHMRLAAR